MTAAGFLVLVIVVSFATIGGSAPPQNVRVDASPFATVTIRSSEGDTMGVFETPFHVALPPGAYTFEFRSGEQTQSQSVSVASDTGAVVRADFWHPDQTRRLLEAYR
jgi:hypothetical protein